MSKIQKALRGMNRKERQAFSLLLRQLHKDYTKIPDCIPLKGMKNVYRARIGRFRVIFRMQTGKQAEALKVAKRDERTYKDL